MATPNHRVIDAKEVAIHSGRGASSEASTAGQNTLK
jgi:hypothetical protein